LLGLAIRQKNTPHYLGSKTAKSKGLKEKFYKFFLRVGFISVSTLEIIHRFSL